MGWFLLLWGSTSPSLMAGSGLCVQLRGSAVQRTPSPRTSSPTHGHTGLTSALCLEKETHTLQKEPNSKPRTKSTGSLVKCFKSCFYDSTGKEKRRLHLLLWFSWIRNTVLDKISLQIRPESQQSWTLQLHFHSSSLTTLCFHVCLYRYHTPGPYGALSSHGCLCPTNVSVERRKRQFPA